MALKFNDSKGGAQKGANMYTYVNGENRIRLIGDIAPRYVYWIKGENDKSIPMECLAFDRNIEAFNNKEKDWVKEFYPDLKCTWAYAMQAIVDGEVKLVNLKRKLFEQIMETSDDLGDPTDPEKGWDVVFTRKKTGTHAFNVEYTLNPLRCTKRPLNDEEKALLAELKSMDEVMPRPTPEAQKELLEKVTRGNNSSEVDEESIEKDFEVN